MVAIACGEAPNSPMADELSLQKIKIVRRFKVECTSLADGVLEVISCRGLPTIWSSYLFEDEFWRTALMRRFSKVERLAEGSLFWNVDCEYETPDPGKRDAANQENNPLLEPPECDLTHEVFQDIVYQSVAPPGPFAGQPRPVQNSAGETFDPPPTRDRSRAVLTIARNEIISSGVVLKAQAYCDAVNSDTFWGASPGTVKCQGITVKETSKQLPNQDLFFYLRVTYVFHFRDTWDLQLLDQGSFYLDSLGNRKAFKASDGHTYKGLLNGAGGQLPANGTPVYLPAIQIYQRLPFANLRLPQTFASVAVGSL